MNKLTNEEAKNFRTASVEQVEADNLAFGITISGTVTDTSPNEVCVAGHMTAVGPAHMLVASLLTSVKKILSDESDPAATLIASLKFLNNNTLKETENTVADALSAIFKEVK